MKKGAVTMLSVGLMILVSSCFKKLNLEESLPAVGKQAGVNQYAPEDSLKVLQFNTWMQGKTFNTGPKELASTNPGRIRAVKNIVNEIAARKPDFITLVEMQGDLENREITDMLKELGLTYYISKDYGSTAVLSKYPLIESGEKTSSWRIVANVNGREIAIYSIHLNYLRYACYLPRGYDGNGDALPSNSDVVTYEKIAEENLLSKRTESMQEIIRAAENDLKLGRIVIFGGDFNEPSHLDWTERTKNLYDHNGFVVPWTTTKALEKAGFQDTYRAIYPNELTHPGFTWVYRNSWAKTADERDRIDYIFSYPDPSLKILNSFVVGPDSSLVKNVLEKEKSLDKFSLPIGSWPSDHKALMTTFALKKPIISMDKKVFSNIESIPVILSEGIPNQKAWIGIFKKGEEPNKNTYLTYIYTNAMRSGAFNLKISPEIADGEYYAAYFQDNGYKEISQRVAFKILK